MKTINNFRRAIAVVAIATVPAFAHASLNTDRLPEAMSQPLNTQITAPVAEKFVSVKDVPQGQSTAATQAFFNIRKASSYSTGFQVESLQKEAVGHNEDW